MGWVSHGDYGDEWNDDRRIRDDSSMELRKGSNRWVWVGYRGNIEKGNQKVGI